MAEKFVIDGIDYTGSIIGQRDMGKSGWTDAGWKKFINGECTAEAHRTNRTISVTLQLEDSTADAVLAKFEALKASLAKPSFKIVSNWGGTSVDRVYECYGSGSPIELPSKLNLEKLPIIRVSVSIEARPLSHDESFQLPRNYIKDSAMQDDWDGDGVCNSFVEHATGSGDGALTMDPDGWQKIVMTAGTEGDEYGVTQSAVFTIDGTVDDFLSSRIDYMVGALQNCTAQIYLYANVSGALSLLDSTTPDVGESTAHSHSLNVTTDTTARLYCCLRADPSSPPAYGVLYVRNALAYRGEDLIENAQGVPLWHESEVSGTPSHVGIKNLPGDVDASAIIRLVQPTDSDMNPRPILGLPYLSRELTDGNGRKQGYIKKFTDAADAYALGGKCSAAIGHGDELIIDLGNMSGRFLVMADIMSDSSSATTDEFHLHLYADRAQAVPVNVTDPITPFAAADKWHSPIFGQVTIPLGSDPDWDTFLPGAYPTNSLGIKSSGGTGTGWYADTVVFIPLDGGHLRFEEAIPTAGMHAIISDTLSNMPGMFWEYQSTAPVSFSVGSGPGYDYNYSYASHQDYLDRIITVAMNDIPVGAAFSGFTPATVSLSSESETIRRFLVPVGWAGSFTAGRTASALPFHMDAIHNKGASAAIHLAEPLFLRDGRYVVRFDHYVNDANQQYDHGGVLVDYRISPRYVD
jgi:hypothetical protein